MHLLLPAVEVSPLPFPTTVPSAMFFLLLAYSSCLYFIGPSRAQVSATNCTYSNYTWSLNTLQQSPCLVGAYLSGVCSNGTFDIGAVTSPSFYAVPGNANSSSDPCLCNTVVYNLLSACSACQGSTWPTYTLYLSNHTPMATGGIFPEPVPAGVRVPKWAYIDTSVGGTWDPLVAQDNGDSPEVTGTSSIVPTSTTSSIVPTSTSQVSQSNITPSASGGSSSTSTSNSISLSTSTSTSSSNAGVIAGGIVGSIVGAALISGVVVWFVVRRRRTRSPPSDTRDQGGKMGQSVSVPNPPTIEMQTLYDPSDPKTYPSKEHVSIRNQSLDSTHHLRPNRYNGLPEI